MSKKFAELNRKSGDLYLIQTDNGSLFVSNAIEKIGDDSYRAYFSFAQDGKIFDSSVTCKEAQIKQMIRNGIAVWFNRG